MTAQPRFEDIVENFELFDDWEDRYRYVIELGREMAPLDDALKVPAYKVEGCASQVWLVPRIEEGADGVARLDFQGDSDAMTVRGLIAVLHALYAGLPVREAARVDALAELSRLELQSHLSAQRSNGLKAMIQRLGELSRAAA